MQGANIFVRLGRIIKGGKEGHDRRIFSPYPLTKEATQKPPVIFLGSILVPGDAFLLDSLAVTANL